jgi:diguanylate cyclase
MRREEPDPRSGRGRASPVGTLRLRMELAGLPARWRAASVWPKLMIGYYVGYTAWYFLAGTTGQARTFVSDIAYLPLGVVGILLAARAAVRAQRRRDRTVWVLIALALVFRGEGDAMWWWLEAVQQQDPFPSMADIGYSGFYPVLIAALAMTPVRQQSRRASIGNLLDVLAMVGGAFMLIWYFVLGAALQAGVNSLASVVNISYPLWDLLLMLAAGRIVLRGTEALWTAAARWLIAGACSFVFADVGFSYLMTQDGFTGGGWLDLFWTGALLCFGMAACARPDNRAPKDDADRNAHLLPLLAIVASYLVVAKVARDLPLIPVGGVVLADLLITVVVVIRQVLAVADHRALAASYRQIAVTDFVTGVSSRQHFLAQAEISLARHRGRCALIMVDVDHFKSINDRHGHLTGDAALRAVAEHLRQTVRDDDLVARFGGDEFVVLLTDVDFERAASVVSRIVSTIVPLWTGGPTLTLSVGWAWHDADLNTLLGQADTALYAAKTAGRNQAIEHNLPDQGGTMPTGGVAGRGIPVASPTPNGERHQLAGIEPAVLVWQHGSGTRPGAPYVG